MRVALDGRAEITEDFARHFDTCLGCMACMTACPSGVQYDKLVESTRSQIERHTTRTLANRFFRRLIFAVFPYPNRLRWVALGLWQYQASGLQRLFRATGLARLLPAHLRAMEAMAPQVSLAGTWHRTQNIIAAEGGRRRRVGLLLGCVQRVFFSKVTAATARVLSAEGCEVVVPPRQGCCGALMLHAGLEAEAAAMARQFIDAFDGAEIDTLVINAAGCGSTLKEYGHLLRDDPAYAAKAATLAAKCQDISEVLAELKPRALRHPIALTVAYHDACHLQHAQGVTAEPRRVLATIPGLKVRDIPESGLCCGSAGIYNLVEPATAQELGERKVGHLLTTGADAVVSSNPGCLLQLESGLRTAGSKMRTMHFVELLDASIRATMPM